MSEPIEMRRVVLTLAPDTVNASADPTLQGEAHGW